MLVKRPALVIDRCDLLNITLDHSIAALAQRLPRTGLGDWWKNTPSTSRGIALIIKDLPDDNTSLRGIALGWRRSVSELVALEHSFECRVLHCCVVPHAVPSDSSSLWLDGLRWRERPRELRDVVLSWEVASVAHTA